MTIHQPQSTYEPTDGTAALSDDPPIEGNDPFGMRRFSLSRYSVRHMLMMLVTAGILCAITARAAWAQDWFVLVLSAAGLALISLVMLLMVRMVVRRVIVEQWIRRLGMGDFDYTVEPWGSDELSKCCVALEALRLKAIEAMQMDLGALAVGRTPAQERRTGAHPGRIATNPGPDGQPPEARRIG